MEIKEVGYFFSSDNNDVIAFFSDDYFIDAGMLLIRMSELMEEFQEYFSLENGGVVYLEKSTDVDMWFEYKKGQLDEFYSHGGTVVVVADAYPIIYLTKKSSGQIETSYSINFLNLLFAGEIVFSLSPDKGSSQIFDPLASEIVGNFESSFHFTFNNIDKPVTTIGTTKKSLRRISILATIHKGKVLVLPDIEIKDQKLDPVSRRKLFMGMVKHTISAFSEDLARVTEHSPDWVSDIIFEKQVEISVDLAEREEAVKREMEKLAISKAKFQQYEIIKSISFTKGKHLELGIRTCLEHLGIDFIVPAGSNTDLVIKRDDQIFAIEIKGVSGSAAKSHTRQLEDWVNRCAEEYGVDDVKGILIINCFHDLPIDSRNERHFPENVVEYSEPRGQCLMTTVSLLKLISQFDAVEITTNEILDLWHGTNGVLDISL